MRNTQQKDNWYALLITILSKKTPHQALQAMRIQEEGLEGKAWKWNRDITDSDLERFIKLKKLYNDISIPQLMKLENINGISACALSKRIQRYQKKCRFIDDAKGDDENVQTAI